MTKNRIKRALGLLDGTGVLRRLDHHRWLTLEIRKEKTDWDGVYRRVPASVLPWSCDQLDSDVAEWLGAEKLGGRALDLGTGAGSQALALASFGCEVTATDLSEAAIGWASSQAARLGIWIDFRVDDVTATRLRGQFDLILDRGCLHSLPRGQHPAYVAAIHKLLAPSGVLLLKCLSETEREVVGPRRFSPAEIRDLLSGRLSVESISRTTFQGPGGSGPEALFCVLRGLQPKAEIGVR